MNQTCYLIGFLDITQVPPVLKRFDLASESAETITHNMAKEVPFLYFETSGRTYGEARKTMIRAIKTALADKHSKLAGNEWARPFFWRLLDEEGDTPKSEPNVSVFSSLEEDLV